jgi:2-methylcitrate dehydratase PrpD
MDKDRSGYSEQIAEFCSNFDLTKIPKDVMERAKLIILDTLGAILAASHPKYPAGRILADFIRREGDRGEATIIGRDFMTTAINAALVNATMGYFCDIESCDFKATLHAPAVILPSVLAVGERLKASGAEVITSFVLGIDIETRIARAISPMGMYDRGFHPSAVCGCFGAAIAAGKVLDLNKNQFLNAIGLCGCQASGLLAWESDKTEMSRPFNLGIAARNGLLSALLAKEGFAGPEVFEGKYTIFKAFSGKERYEELLKDLGKNFAIMDQSIKKYACCAYIQPGLDALLKILKDHTINPEEIQKITMKVPSKEILNLIDTSTLRSHDARYILAVGAFNKEVLTDDILQDRYSNIKIFELAKRIELRCDEKLADLFPRAFPTIIEVETKGRVFMERVDYARGDPENPMTKNEVEGKFVKLATTVIDEARAFEIAKLIDGLEKIDEIGELTRLLRFKQ